MFCCPPLRCCRSWWCTNSLRGRSNSVSSVFFRGLATERIREVMNVPYVEGSTDTKQTLDFYYPFDDSPPGSTVGYETFVLVVHGGAWMSGGKGWFFGRYGRVGKFIAECGYPCAVMNYRMFPFVSNDQQVADVAAAVDWLATEGYHLCNKQVVGRHTEEQIYVRGGAADPANFGVVLLGESAGAQLCGLVMTNERYLARHMLTANTIKGFIGVSGIYDLHAMGYPGGSLFRYLVFGANWELLSPLRYLNDRVAKPTMLVNTAHPWLDLNTHTDTQRFAEALEQHGIPPVIHNIEGSHHFNVFSYLHREDCRVARALCNFLDRVDKNSTPTTTFSMV